MTRRFFISGILCGLVVPLLISGMVGASSAGGNQDSATLHRFPDPVLVKASALPLMNGQPLGEYRLYASRQGRLEPVRFQIDEMTPEGDFVFPYGRKNNKELSNGLLDPQDVLLFMAHDAGDKVAKRHWPAGCGKGVEIRIVDPLDGTSAWAYFVAFPAAPPPLSLLPDYCTYDHESATTGGEYWRSRSTITRDGARTTFYEEFCILPKAGGSGANFIDRLKVRIMVELLFGKVRITVNEETLETEVLAWMQGPIRSVRRVESYVKGPFGMRVARGIADMQCYESMTTIPVDLKVPFKVEKVLTSLVARFGTDYAPVVKGSVFYNSQNPRGVRINGRVDESEKGFDPGQDQWRVMVGEWGALMSRNIFTEAAVRQMDIVQGVLDDERVQITPERYPGSVGYTWQDWNVGQLSGGHYTFYLEMYTPPYYKPGDEGPYLNYLDHPLVVRIADQEYQNQVKIIAIVGKDF